MALNGDAMGNAMATQMIALMGDMDDASEEKVREGCRAMGRGIVAHIQASLQVTLRLAAGGAGIQRLPVAPFDPTLGPELQTDLPCIIA